MKYAAAVVGNSSSGVVETPTFRVPAVNIGARQKGRIICANVLCCEADEASIRTAVETALSPAFRQKAAGAKAHMTAAPPRRALWRRWSSGRKALAGPKIFMTHPVRRKGMSWDEIIAALSMLWARQKPELLQLLQPGLYKALRLALVGTVMMAVLLAALLVVRLVKKKKGPCGAGRVPWRAWAPARRCICRALCFRPAGPVRACRFRCSAHRTHSPLRRPQAQVNAEANKAQSEQAAMENETGTAVTQASAQMGQVPAEARRLTVTQEGPAPFCRR